MSDTFTIECAACALGYEYGHDKACPEYGPAPTELDPIELDDDWMLDPDTYNA